MEPSISQESRLVRIPFSKIVFAGLVAGVLDIGCAFLNSYIRKGILPQKILQYIAKTVMGSAFLSNSFMLSLSGLLFHMVIALTWTIFFFHLYCRFRLMRINHTATGIFFGLLVWIGMNLVAVPLWTGHAIILDLANVSVGAIILIFAIGLPLSFLAKRFSKTKE